MKNLMERLTRAILEAEGGDEDEKKRRKSPEDIDDDDMGDDDDFLGDEDPDDAGDEEDEGGEEDFEDDLELLDDEGDDFGGDEFDDLEIEDSSDLDLDLEDDEMGMEDEVDDLLDNEPPMPMEDPFEEEGLEKTSSFEEFITNQLLDFPVESVNFPPENEGGDPNTIYVDAKFGDSVVSFALYSGDEGQPLLAVLTGDEVHRTELASEAVTGDSRVRDEFMPVEFIRDLMSRIVDVAPTYEAYRLKRATMDCSETVRKRVKQSMLKETITHCGGGEDSTKNIHNTRLKDPKKAGTRKGNEGAKGGESPKTANLGKPGKTKLEVPGEDAKKQKDDPARKG